MDPNFVINEILELKFKASEHDGFGNTAKADAYRRRALDLFASLDGWMSAGGKRPDRWWAKPALREPDAT